VSFRNRGDLLFCWLEQGECQLIRPRAPPLRLNTDDVALVRTDTPFILTSDATVEPEDSETMTAVTRRTMLRVGKGTNSPVFLHGGRFVFDATNADLLTGLLPSLIHMAGDDPSSARVRCLLKMNAAESTHSAPGSAFVVGRLMELILVELLRSGSSGADQQHTGLIAGLKDPMTARALTAMHEHVAKDWTVARLARLCAVSRSSFATRFRQTVGVAPIEYLQRWRIALAKDALRAGTKSIGEIGLAVGFQSPSAFSTAFTRAVGSPPRQFAASVLRDGR
jgi:AraC-like DNA-binding protein